MLAVCGLLALQVVPVTLAQQGSASVTFDDQLSGGQTVTVANATLPEGGFVALHDATLQRGDVLASVVGASSFLEAGTHDDVTVQLSEPLTSDATLIAMPHKDTDGDRVYSFVADGGQTDGPYTSGGDPVIDDAKVTVSATAELSDQPTDGASILVDEVALSEGGFVTIHDETLLEGMPLVSVIGTSPYLDAGVHEDVRVELDRELTEAQTVLAMPHKDTDDDRTYDFVTSGGQDDGPYMGSDGQPVVDDATATPSDTATVVYDDQTTGGTHVVTARTFLPEGGFIAIHDEGLAQGKAVESVRGASEHLAPGVHEHVTIELDDPLDSSQTITAMPHKDTDGDRAYDFVTSDGDQDGPYTANGSAVVDSGETHYSASAFTVDQESDGRTITIDSVALSGGGFVALHDPSLLAGEVTGSVVGVSAFLSPGHHSDVEVTLDRTLRTSQDLIAMPHIDTDTDQTYDFVTSGGSDDGPFVTASGDPVVVPFRATVRATATIEDQTAKGTVTVATATLHDGGFVTLHDGSLLNGEVLGSVVGVSEKLPPGTHEKIQIDLDTQATGEVTLIAMPHHDSDGDGTYDFVTSEGADDGPYLAGGGAVVDTATVTLQETDDQEGSSADGVGGPDEVAGPGSEAPAADGSDDEQAPAPLPGTALVLLSLAGAALVLLGRR